MYGVRLINDSGVEITSINITYTGEQWRVTDAAPPQTEKLDFAYQVRSVAINKFEIRAPGLRLIVLIL